MPSSPRSSVGGSYASTHGHSASVSRLSNYGSQHEHPDPADLVIYLWCSILDDKMGVKMNKTSLVVPVILEKAHGVGDEGHETPDCESKAGENQEHVEESQ